MMKKIFSLSLAVLFSSVMFAQDCTDFFFSEYVEGTSQNKALEIYNPTGTAKSLSGYTIKRYANGAATADTYLDLVGTVDPYDVWVVTNGQIIENAHHVRISVCQFVNPAAEGITPAKSMLCKHGTVMVYDPGHDLRRRQGTFQDF